MKESADVPFELDVAPKLLGRGNFRATRVFFQLMCGMGSCIEGIVMLLRRSSHLRHCAAHGPTRSFVRTFRWLMSNETKPIAALDALSDLGDDYVAFRDVANPALRNIEFHLFGTFHTYEECMQGANTALNVLKPDTVVMGLNKDDIDQKSVVPALDSGGSLSRMIFQGILNWCNFPKMTDPNVMTPELCHAARKADEVSNVVYADRPNVITAARTLQLLFFPEKIGFYANMMMLSMQGIEKRRDPPPIFRLRAIDSDTRGIMFERIPPLQLTQVFEKDVTFMRTLKEEALKLAPYATPNNRKKVLGIFSKVHLHGILEAWPLPVSERYVKQLQTQSEGMDESVAWFDVIANSNVSADGFDAAKVMEERSEKRWNFLKEE